MSTKVKICGITTLADARYAAGAGADYVGFILYDKSPRYIEPQRAKEIIQWLYGPDPVGVFVDHPIDELNSVVASTGFKLAQLHGSESPDYCDQVGVPVIKSFALQPGETASEMVKRMTPYIGVVDYVLIDTYSPGQFGGTGVENDFSSFARVQFPLPVFAAGGLNPRNVSRVVSELRPFALDVSSGVEESPGVKDFEKIDEFMTAVRRETETESGL